MSEKIEKLYGVGGNSLTLIENGDGDGYISVGCCCTFVGMASDYAVGGGAFSLIFGSLSGSLIKGYEDDRTWFKTETSTGSYIYSSQFETCLCKNTIDKEGSSYRVRSSSVKFSELLFRTTYYSFPETVTENALETMTICDCAEGDRECRTTSNTNSYYSGGTIESNTLKKTTINENFSESNESCNPKKTLTNFTSEILNATTTLSGQVQPQQAWEWAKTNFLSDETTSIEEANSWFYNNSAAVAYLEGAGNNTTASYRYTGSRKYRIAYSKSPTCGIKITLRTTITYSKQIGSESPIVTTKIENSSFDFSTPKWDDESKCPYSDLQPPDADGIMYSDTFTLDYILDEYPLVSDTYDYVEVSAEVRIISAELISDNN